MENVKYIEFNGVKCTEVELKEVQKRLGLTRGQLEFVNEEALRKELNKLHKEDFVRRLGKYM